VHWIPAVDPGMAGAARSTAHG